MLTETTCQAGDLFSGFDVGKLGSSHWLVHHPAHWLVLAGFLDFFLGCDKSLVVLGVFSVETDIVLGL